ncbi:MAG: TIGR04282 family arsenosugar biosynthesis glycosyltransferase [Ilumatobacter sp.]|uniref:TIGR04282 family arsenosugar biosynthesis glycosyltransferase n=1 Tax=Ilumatobacter sp. TaxID=1967498 RepID=UPI003298B978
MNGTNAVVVVMAKAPVPGFAKTRLIPALGQERAGALATWLLDRTMAAALEAGIGPVELRCTPDTAHPAFGAWAQRSGVTLEVQGEGDLGARMERAFERWQGVASQVLVIGTDAPHLDAGLLRDAADALLEHDAVFVPAYDGGYALVGLRRPQPSLFDDMEWSTPDVMEHTRRRVRSCGLRHRELATIHDIDEPDDLAHLTGLGWR